MFDENLLVCSQQLAKKQNINLFWKSKGKETTEGLDKTKAALFRKLLREHIEELHAKNSSADGEEEDK